MYDDYDDQELMYLIAEKSEDASNILYEKYKHLANIKAKKYVNYGKKIGLDYNDLFQEGMVGLSEAINSYDEDRDTKFFSFANLCMNRQISSAVVSASRKKHNALNESYSLDILVDNDSVTFLNIFFDKGSDPSVSLDKEENKKAFNNILNKELTPFEKQVFDLRLAGFEYKEIASLLNKSYKSVDSAVQRMRLKVKNALDM